jgi:NCS1 family nucleobase:cation symporter-1
MHDHSPAAAGAVRHLDKLYEFDREPVTPDRWLGPGYFAGSFAGEHVAATEFVIGVLFINWGAGVRDIFLGLAIGNLLAVLSWTLICAPVAVDTRLTLYWYLRRIGGPFLTVVYNILNAVLFCILAGCMITVSASAVRIPFGIPAQVRWYPTDWRFVVVVLAVGAVVVTLAILGFKKLASFATVCSPWMMVMFVAGALMMLPRLAMEAGLPVIDNAATFFDMARKVVWIGATPDGSPPLGLPKIIAFAWICNLAMHAGLSDMALFRFARKPYYGLFSACGMFLGHYVAWIAAGLMGAGAALLLRTPLPQLDSGEVAYQALGWAGVLAVIIAGWTTSNPTLYRAGLALQAITPNWSRTTVTLVAGAVTTIIACFPFVFTRLLDFVGIYGLLLAPAGAIVVTEHWLFPRFGLQRYWSSQRHQLINWAAMGAWCGGMGTGLLLERTGSLHLFFLFLPVYTLTSVLYLCFASWAGARQSPSTTASTVTLHPTAQPRLPQPARRLSPLGWLAGATAVAALAACLWISWSVSRAPASSFLQHARQAHFPLLAATLVYFVAGTAFYRCREKSKS